MIYKHSWGEVVEHDAGVVETEIERQIAQSPAMDARIDVEMVVVDGTEYGKRLNVALLTGSQVDAFLVGANDIAYWWRKGVPRPLTNVIEDHGPALRQAFPERVWERVTVDGEIIAVPGWSEATGNSIVVRKDILDNYDLPLPSTIAELEAVSEELIRRDPQIIPITGAWWDFAPILCPALGIHHWEEIVVDHERRMVLHGNQLPDFYLFFETLRRWLRKGYLDPAVLETNFARTRELFFEGKNVFTFNKAERLHDWGKLLAEQGSQADLTVIPELNDAGVWSSTGEIPHVLIIPRSSEHPVAVIKYLNWVFSDNDNYLLANLGLPGRHYVPREFSFEPIEPLRFRGVFIPVFNRRFSLPDATRYEAWYEGIDKVRSVETHSNEFDSLVLFDRTLEEDYPEIEQFNQQWWRYLEGEIEATSENYASTLKLYFENGGREIARTFYEQYVTRSERSSD